MQMTPKAATRSEDTQKRKKLEILVPASHAHNHIIYSAHVQSHTAL
jgi:hypothetical protein